VRILIVEDDFISRRLLQRLLSPYGTCDPYGLVCLDIMMPVMNGHEALKEIRRIEAEKKVDKNNFAKVIMVTAAATQKDVVKAGLNKCDGYLLKPIDTHKLHQTLRSFGFEKEQGNANINSGR